MRTAVIATCWSSGFLTIVPSSKMPKKRYLLSEPDTSFHLLLYSTFPPISQNLNLLPKYKKKIISSPFFSPNESIQPLLPTEKMLNIVDGIDSSIFASPQENLLLQLPLQPFLRLKRQKFIPHLNRSSD